MMSQATADIVGPVLGMLGAAIALAACLPVAGRVLDARGRATLTAAAVAVATPLRGWHVPTGRVTRPAYAPTRRARRNHAGAHRWTGLAPGQRWAPTTLTTRHQVRSHAA